MTMPVAASEAVCLNVGRRLAHGEIDAATALAWLRGWVRTKPAFIVAECWRDGQLLARWTTERPGISFHSRIPLLQARGWRIYEVAR